MGTVNLEVLQPIGLDVKEGKTNAAQRLDNLEGKRIGLVWNSKEYGDKLLDKVEELLADRYPTTEISRWRLRECCQAPPDGELENIAEKVDAVVYTLGD